MTTQHPVRGRDRLLDAADRLLADARNRRGGALVVLGDLGMGKTTVLRAIRDRPTGFLGLRTAGVGAEAALPMSGLHRLLQPLTRHGSELAGPQRTVLTDLLGRRTTPAGADFALCSALHRLFVDLARGRPVLCCVDDAHALDPVSAVALAFVARRAGTERIGIVFAGECGPDTGTAVDPFAGIPAVRLGPLSDEAGAQLLADRGTTSGAGWLAPDVAADIVALACGNPLALAEFAVTLTPEQRSGEAAPPTALPRHSRLRRTIGSRFARLSGPARRVILMAVVDDRMTVDNVLHAAEQDGRDLTVLDEATASGLVVVDDETVAVTSGLVRATLRAEASAAERHAAHRALAELLDADRDGLRRIWHRAVTDLAGRERLAVQLRDGASAARANGNRRESATAFERAAALTRHPATQATWLLDAAEDAWVSGGTRRTRALLRQAIPLTTAGGPRAVVDLMQGAIALRDGSPAVAGQYLRTAAEQLVATDRPAALTALVLAGEASCLIGDYAGYSATARRVAGLRTSDESAVAELIFDHFGGMAATYQARHEDAHAPLRNVLRLADSVDDVTSLILASQAAYALGDLARSFDLAVRAVRTARRRALLTLVPWALVYVSMSALLLDRHATAVSAATEGLRESQAIGLRNCAVDHLMILAMLAASQGDRETALCRVDSAAEWVGTQGLARPGTLGSWAVACLDLADDRPTDALDRLRLMAAGAGRVHLAIRVMAAPHVVEAGVRTRQLTPAVHALAAFDRWVGDSGCAPRLALSHRCHALLAERPVDADEHFREAIRLHRSSATALELAKTELFYAARLRRGRQPTAARELLRDAVKIFHDYHANRGPGGPPRSCGRRGSRWAAGSRCGWAN